MRRVRIRAVRAPAVRVVPVAMVRRVVRASMRVRTSNAHSLHARTATAHAVIVHRMALRAARTPDPAATARRAIAPAATVQVAIQVDNTVAPEARRRTRARTARVRIDPTMLRVVRVTKDCHATRIDEAA